MADTFPAATRRRSADNPPSHSRFFLEIDIDAPNYAARSSRPGLKVRALRQLINLRLKGEVQGTGYSARGTGGTGFGTRGAAHFLMRGRAARRRPTGMVAPTLRSACAGGLYLAMAGQSRRYGTVSATGTCHGHPGHARARAGRPWHVSVPTSRSAQRPRVCPGPLSDCKNRQSQISNRKFKCAEIANHQSHVTNAPLPPGFFLDKDFDSPHVTR